MKILSNSPSVLAAALVLISIWAPLSSAQQQVPTVPPAPPAAEACVNCDANFICQDNPGVPGPVQQGWTEFTIWLDDGVDANGNKCWKLHNIAVEFQWVTLTLCDGTEISVKRNSGVMFKESMPVLRYCEGGAYPFGPGGDADKVVNPPPSGGAAPLPATTPAPAGPQVTKICHTTAFFPCPFPYPPNTPPPPAPTLPGVIQPGGTAVPDDAASAISGSNGYEQVECTDPPAEGVVVMIYCSTVAPGPPDSDGNYPLDPDSTHAVHSAVSNGDGTYMTKNGRNKKDESASKEKAIDTYTDDDASDGEVCYEVCFQKVQ